MEECGIFLQCLSDGLCTSSPNLVVKQAKMKLSRVRYCHEIPDEVFLFGPRIEGTNIVREVLLESQQLSHQNRGVFGIGGWGTTGHWFLVSGWWQWSRTQWVKGGGMEGSGIQMFLGMSLVG